MAKYVRRDVVEATGEALEVWGMPFSEPFHAMVSAAGEAAPLSHEELCLQVGWEELQTLVGALHAIEGETGRFAEFRGFTLSYLVSVWTNLRNETRAA